MRAHFACVCASVALAVAGCSLDRVSLGGQGIDSGPGVDSGPAPDDGGRPDSGEGGAECTPGSCDDGNVCTNDTCDPATGCVFSPVPGGCDDGVLCNGGDSCMDGTCSAHDGVNPCAGSSTCDPITNTCVGCVTDSDCPADMPGDFGACEFPAGDVCVTTGMQTREVRSYTCSAGMCVPAERTEMQACSRTTDDVSCGEPTYGDWSGCGFASDCATSGTRARSVTARVCGAGVCTSATSTESGPCTRGSTDGNSCGTYGCSAWSVCFGDQLNECSGWGGQYRECGVPVCAGGVCSMAPAPGTGTVQPQACTLGNGSGCGTAVTCGPCHDRDDMSACNGRGVQTCTITTGTCGGSGCVPNGGTAPFDQQCNC